MPLSLVRRTGSPFWYLRGTVRGRSIFETTGTDREDVADAIRIKREAEILDRSVFGARAVVTFAEAAAIYLEAGGSPRFVGKIDRKTGKWTGLIGHFGTTKLSAIGQLEIDKAARTLYPRASAETRNRQVYTPFIAIWTKAQTRGLCDMRRWERPKMTAKPRDRWATEGEVARLLGSASPHVAPLVRFLVMTGARMSEALYLDWADVDLSAAWAVFRDTKRHGESRGVPLHPTVVVDLANMRHRTGAVFRTQKGEPYHDTGKESGGQVKTAWAGMCRRAGVVGVTPHTLRHTFSTWLTARGVSERIRDELMGHASSDTGRRYAHVPRDTLVKAVAALPSIAPNCAESVQSHQTANGKRRKTAASG